MTRQYEDTLLSAIQTTRKHRQQIEQAFNSKTLLLERTQAKRIAKQLNQKLNELERKYEYLVNGC